MANGLLHVLDDSRARTFGQASARERVASRESGTEFVLRFPDQASVTDTGSPAAGQPIAADGFARQ